MDNIENADMAEMLKRLKDMKARECDLNVAKACGTNEDKANAQKAYDAAVKSFEEGLDTVLKEYDPKLKNIKIPPMTQATKDLYDGQKKDLMNWLNRHAKDKPCGGACPKTPIEPPPGTTPQPEPNTPPPEKPKETPKATPKAAGEDEERKDIGGGPGCPSGGAQPCSDTPRGETSGPLDFFGGDVSIGIGGGHEGRYHDESPRDDRSNWGHKRKRHDENSNVPSEKKPDNVSPESAPQDQKDNQASPPPQH